MRGATKQWRWLPWQSPADLTQAIHDNLRNLGLDVIEAVNFRSMHGMQARRKAPSQRTVRTLAELKRQGLIKHIGVSNVTPTQIKEAQEITPDRLRAESTTTSRIAG